MAALCLAGCGQRQPVPIKLQGATMGTTWHLTYLASADTPAPEAVKEALQVELEAVNASMSTYRENSEISRFNRSPPGGWMPVSAGFVQVLQAALDIGKRSDGAYDVTIAPLVELWGFGPGARRESPPSATAIRDALATVGQGALELDTQGLRVRKLRPLALDFSSIAKGYAVDRLASWLLGQQIDNFLVEVGGEMRLQGQSPRGDAWRIAIEEPAARRRQPLEALSLSDVAVATSGDYRNYFEVDGARYSHSIDPRTGRAVAHDLVSVTVVGDSAMLADAWATALVVLGGDAAWQVASEAGLAVYFIRRGSDDTFTARHTAAFAPYLAEPEGASQSGAASPGG